MIDRGTLILMCLILGFAFAPGPGRTDDAKKPAIPQSFF